MGTMDQRYAAACIALLLSASGSGIAQQPPFQPAVENTAAVTGPAVSSIVQAYSGVLPCADCSGIRIELRLYSEQASGRPLKYELVETYLGTRDADRTVRRAGRWTVLRGSASDSDAIVYQLDFDRPKMAQNFLKVGTDELRLLDGAQHEIRTPAPHTLRRVRKEPAMSEVTLSQSDAGRTIDLARGQRMVIRLRSNPTTGYRWQLATPASGGVLTNLGEPTYTADTAPANAVGGGGIEVWSFEASRSGEGQLVFEYRRAWERDAPAAQTLSYPIKVR